MPKVKPTINSKVKQIINKYSKELELIQFIDENNEYDFKLRTKFAPLVSLDNERSFSLYKEIL